MTRWLRVAAGVSIWFSTACGGSAPLPPPGLSSTFAVSADRATISPVTSAPPMARSGSVTSSGTVGPLREGMLPCFAERYPCETYDFSLVREGSIEVTMTWEGPPRALLVQLYWAGEGLAHEDVAPRDGPSRIWFRRPLMEAADYRLRVVSLEPDHAIPFTLTLTH